MDNSTKIRDLQTKIISLRLEIPTVYAKFLKKDYACFIQNLQTGQCIMPDNLASVTIDNPTEFVFPEETPKINVDDILKKTSNALKCYKMIKHSKKSI